MNNLIALRLIHLCNVRQRFNEITRSEWKTKEECVEYLQMNYEDHTLDGDPDYIRKSTIEASMRIKCNEKLNSGVNFKNSFGDVVKSVENCRANL